MRKMRIALLIRCASGDYLHSYMPIFTALKHCSPFHEKTHIFHSGDAKRMGLEKDNCT